ncbi:MAG: hypothetical protein ACYTXA_08870 [Nostoc sp.]
MKIYLINFDPLAIMSITLTQKEEDELWAEVNHNSAQQPEREPFAILRKVPCSTQKLQWLLGE